MLTAYQLNVIWPKACLVGYLVFVNKNINLRDDMFSVFYFADSSVEARLRDLGFGYRAQFLQRSAKKIVDTYGLQWLESLRSVPYFQACDALRTLPGVGTKVQQPHTHTYMLLKNMTVK